MTAGVFNLPGAAKEPLPKQRLPRRYPPGVIPLWRGRQLREERRLRDAALRSSIQALAVRLITALEGEPPELAIVALTAWRERRRSDACLDSLDP